MASNKAKGTSSKQSAANRRNANKSTGPKTKLGKQRVKLNALKHGLLAKQVLLPGEDADSFHELSDQLYADLAPVGGVEAVLVERILGGLWRLQRLQRVEAGMFENEISGVLRDRQEEELPLRDRELRAALNPQAAATEDERTHAVEKAGAAEWGAAFVRDAKEGNAFSKLSRYETSIERSVISSLHELQRLQAARLGQPGLLPVAADITVSLPGE